MLHAPNVIGLVYLLKERASQLQKTISKISVFYTYDEEADEDIRVDMWDLLIELAPIMQCSKKKKKRMVKSLLC